MIKLGILRQEDMPGLLSFHALACTVICNHMDHSHQAPFHGIAQARILKQVPFPSPGDLFHPGIEPMSPVSPALAVDSLPLSHLGSLSSHMWEKREREQGMWRQKAETEENVQPLNKQSGGLQKQERGKKYSLPSRRNITILTP